MKARKEKKDTSFEDSFKRLENILETLEADDCTLEETITMYEEGLALCRICYDKLNNAELRIKEINRSTKGEIEIKEYKQ